MTYDPEHGPSKPLQGVECFKCMLEGQTLVPMSKGWREGSVGKSACCISMRSRVQIPRGHRYLLTL